MSESAFSFPVIGTTEHDPDDLGFSGAVSLSTTAHYSVRGFAIAGGAVLTIPTGKTHKIFNATSVAFTVAGTGVSSITLNQGEQVIFAWDVQTAAHKVLQFQATTDDSITVTSHGFTSTDIGKPVGWRSNGTLVVWNNAASTESPIAVIRQIIDTNTLQLAGAGRIVSTAGTLLPTDIDTKISTLNDRYMYWNFSNGKYEYTSPVGSVIVNEICYVARTDPTAAGRYLCIVIIPDRPSA